MLKKFFSTLVFETLPLVGTPATAGAAQIGQDSGMPDASDKNDSLPLPGLMYRRESVSKFFCIHD